MTLFGADSNLNTNTMKNTYKILLVILVIALFTIPAFAGPGPPPATPIDGGLSLLLAAGGAYGVNRLRKMKGSEKY